MTISFLKRKIEVHRVKSDKGELTHSNISIPTTCYKIIEFHFFSMQVNWRKGESCGTRCEDTIFFLFLLATTQPRIYYNLCKWRRASDNKHTRAHTHTWRQTQTSAYWFKLPSENTAFELERSVWDETWGIMGIKITFF